MIAREELTKYFGFEGFGLLFKDVKSWDLFSYERDFSTQEQHDIAMLKEKKKEGFIMTVDERLRDIEYQLRPGTKNRYPNTLGITGEVYKTREIYY